MREELRGAAAGLQQVVSSSRTHGLLFFCRSACESYAPLVAQCGGPAKSRIAPPRRSVFQELWHSPSVSPPGQSSHSAFPPTSSEDTVGSVRILDWVLGTRFADQLGCGFRAGE